MTRQGYCSNSPGDLLEKSSGASLLRAMIGLAAQRLMTLETDALPPGATSKPRVMSEALTEPLAGLSDRPTPWREHPASPPISPRISTTTSDDQARNPAVVSVRVSFSTMSQPWDAA